MRFCLSHGPCDRGRLLDRTSLWRRHREASRRSACTRAGVIGFETISMSASTASESSCRADTVAVTLSPFTLALIVHSASGARMATFSPCRADGALSWQFAHCIQQFEC